MRFVDTEQLHIAYLDDGPADGWPVVLSHGFPYDVHAFDEAVPILTDAGARVIRPWCRGFGPTRFQSDAIMRTGQQTARGQDVIQLLAALDLKQPILGGYDWGGNASCVAAALWPDRIGGLVCYAGYDVIDVAAQRRPLNPDLEKVCWYQHLFQTERGRDCLSDYRADVARTLWREWSPGWAFDEPTFCRTAVAFDNPDFVDVVIHCYRWMFGLAEGDPKLQTLEKRLAQRPPVSVPTVTLDGERDPLKPGGTEGHAPMFTARHEHRVVEGGHNLPQEVPGAFADALLTVRSWVN